VAPGIDAKLPETVSHPWAGFAGAENAQLREKSRV
jgi:hypothetical protein